VKKEACVDRPFQETIQRNTKESMDGDMHEQDAIVRIQIKNQFPFHIRCIVHERN
jgi:hypothetical protein